MKYLVLFSFIIFAQIAIGQNSVNASGGDVTGSGGSASTSVGQLVYAYSSGTDGSVSAGVQQTFFLYSTSETTEINKNINMSVYPNPTADKLLLRVDGNEANNLMYQLFDSNGMLLNEGVITSPTIDIQMNKYHRATYFVKVYSDSQELKTFKIIKT